VNLTAYLEAARQQLSQAEATLANFDFSSGDHQRKYEELSREHQRLSRLVKAADKLEQVRNQLKDNHELLAAAVADDDDDFRTVVKADIEELQQRQQQLLMQIKTMLLPPHANDNRNTIVEIRPAAGGDEAGLFAGDLLRMYTRFAELQGWRFELLELNESGIGGLKEAAFSLQGEGVYRFMKFESGVHRVQRVPVTESGGRIHTSTVTVAVLPEAEEVDVQINTHDLRFDVFRSSGPGGQSVNTTDSAVRVTHLPTGISVASQVEKSQHRNKETALRILRSRLFEIKQQQEDAKNAAQRRQQVGSGDRSERIRTYNFPQSRVSDHRFNITRHDLAQILEGELADLLQEIIALDVERRLAAITTDKF